MKKKKWSTFIISIILALVLAACGAQNTQGTETTETITDVQSEAETQETVEEELIEAEEQTEETEDIIELFRGDAVTTDQGEIKTLDSAEEGWEESREKAYKNATSDGKKAPGDRFVRSKEEEVIQLVNAKRAEIGLAPLILDETLMAGAEIRASEQKSLFSHTRPDGRDCFSVLDELGVPVGHQGENLGMGNICSGSKMMDMWMNSEGHRANIMDAGYTKIGVGYFESGNYGYWAQLFSD